MKVESFGKRDISVYFDLKETYDTHYNPPSSPITQEERKKRRKYHLSFYDLTDFLNDFLILTLGNEVLGVAGLLRSSSTEKWSIALVVNPTITTRQQIMLLFEAVLPLIQKSTHEISFVTYSDDKIMNDVARSKGYTPYEYRVDLVLDFEKYKYSQNIPEKIVIQHHADDQEFKEFVRIWNYVSKTNEEFEPITLEHPFIDAIKRDMEKEEAQLFYAYESNKIVGLLLQFFRPKSRQGSLFILAVDPQYQRKGIGTALIHKGIKYLKGKDCQLIQVSGVFYSNKNALNLYLRLGCYKKPHSEMVIYKIR